MAPQGDLFVFLLATAIMNSVAGMPMKEELEDTNLRGNDITRVISPQTRHRRADDVNSFAVTVEQLAQKVTQMDATFQAAISQINTKLQTALDFAAEPMVGFTVRKNGFDQTGYGAGQVINFDNVIFNAGSAYNPSNGLFTAPRPGTYVFFMQALNHGTDTRVFLDIMKNGVFLSRTHAGYSQYESGSNLVVNHLDQGDMIKVEITGGSSFTGDSFSTFAGFRVSSK